MKTSWKGWKKILIKQNIYWKVPKSILQDIFSKYSTVRWQILELTFMLLPFVNNFPNTKTYPCVILEKQLHILLYVVIIISF